MFINIKSAGCRKNSIERREVLFEKMPETAGSLLEEAVKACAGDFRKALSRKEDRPAGEGNLKDMEAAGKISYGKLYNSASADEKTAAENVKQAFLDGEIAVFLDGTALESLETRIALKDTSEVTFIRLVLLSGAYWSF